MREDPLGNEVVRALDVEVVDRAVEHDSFDRLDDVVAAGLGEHGHAGSHGRGRREGKRLRDAQARVTPDAAPAARTSSGIEGEPEVRVALLSAADLHEVLPRPGSAERNRRTISMSVKLCPYRGCKLTTHQTGALWTADSRRSACAQVC